MILTLSNITVQLVTMYAIVIQFGWIALLGILFIRGAGVIRGLSDKDRVLKAHEASKEIIDMLKGMKK